MIDEKTNIACRLETDLAATKKILRTVIEEQTESHKDEIVKLRQAHDDQINQKERLIKDQVKTIKSKDKKFENLRKKLESIGKNYKALKAGGE